MKRIKTAFDLKPIKIPIDYLVETRPLKEASKRSSYQAILASLKTTGLIQPLVVCPSKDNSKTYRILDGHLRFYALRALGKDKVLCILSTDDERYTFDAQINYINPIQRNKMIKAAIKNGVKPERIAAALNIEINTVNKEVNLLNGIHPDVVEVLKDKPIYRRALRVLRRVNAIRQIEMADMMCAVHNFTENYALALLGGTPADQLVKGKKPKAIKGVDAKTLAKMERELESLGNNFEQLQDSYSKNIYTLTVIQSYIKRLLTNERIYRFLLKHKADMLPELEKIAEMETLAT